VSREFSFVSLHYGKKVKPDSGAPDAARSHKVSGSAAFPCTGSDHALMKIDTNRIGGHVAQINITRCKSEKHND
jgi:hypothetical protein